MSDKETVLSLQDALQTIDILEQNRVHILGWEGVIRDADGNLGHGDAPQGTVSLESLTVAEAAQLCRQTIQEGFDEWTRKHSHAGNELLVYLVIEN